MSPVTVGMRDAGPLWPAQCGPGCARDASKASQSLRQTSPKVSSNPCPNFPWFLMPFGFQIASKTHPKWGKIPLKIIQIWTQLPALIFSSNFKPHVPRIHTSWSSKTIDFHCFFNGFWSFSVSTDSSHLTGILVDFGFIFATNISQNQDKNQLKTNSIFLSIFYSIWELFCLPLGFLWVSFWIPWAPFGLPFGCLWVPLGLALARLGLILGDHSAIPTLFTAMLPHSTSFYVHWDQTCIHFWLILHKLWGFWASCWLNFRSANAGESCQIQANPSLPPNVL